MAVKCNFCVTDINGREVGEERVSEMTNGRNYTQRATGNAAKAADGAQFVAEYTNAKSNAQLVIEYAQRAGLIEDATVAKGDAGKFAMMTHGERSDLATERVAELGHHNWAREAATIRAAVQLTGAKLTTFGERQLAWMAKQSATSQVIAEMACTKLNDTPENRENALRKMGINV